MAELENIGLITRLLPTITGREEAIAIRHALSTIKNTAELGKWGEEIKLLILSSRLKDRAYEQLCCIQDNESKLTLNLAIELLEERLLSKGSAHLAVLALPTVKQNENEDIQSYIDRFTSALNNIKRKTEKKDFSEEFTIALFIDGVNSRDARKHLLSLKSSSLVTIIVELKTLSRIDNDSARYPQEVNALGCSQEADHKSTEKLESLEAKMAAQEQHLKQMSTTLSEIVKSTSQQTIQQFQNSSRQNKGTMSNIECWNCRRTGHKAQDCRRKMRQNLN